MVSSSMRKPSKTGAPNDMGILKIMASSYYANVRFFLFSAEGIWKEFIARSLHEVFRLRFDKHEALSAGTCTRYDVHCIVIHVVATKIALHKHVIIFMFEINLSKYLEECLRVCTRTDDVVLPFNLRVLRNSNPFFRRSSRAEKWKVETNWY